jgi:serine protease
VIVKYRADSDMTKKQAMTATGRRSLQVQALGERIGVALTAGSGISERSHVVTGRGLTSASLAARIAAHPDVEYASPTSASTSSPRRTTPSTQPTGHGHVRRPRRRAVVPEAARTGRVRDQHPRRPRSMPSRRGTS